MNTDPQKFFETMAQNMKDVSAESMKGWVDSHKELVKAWRKLVEERSKEDRDLHARIAKSYMATGFQLLDMHRQSLEMAQQTHLEHIDRYLEYLEKMPTGEPPPSGGRKPPARGTRRKS